MRKIKLPNIKKLQKPNLSRKQATLAGVIALLAISAIAAALVTNNDKDTTPEQVVNNEQQTDLNVSSASEVPVTASYTYVSFSPECKEVKPFPDAEYTIPSCGGKVRLKDRVSSEEKDFNLTETTVITVTEDPTLYVVGQLEQLVTAESTLFVTLAPDSNDTLTGLTIVQPRPAATN